MSSGGREEGVSDTVNELRQDLATLILKQMEVGDGPCKFYLVADKKDAPVTRYRLNESYPLEPTQKYLQAFYVKGRMFFSVQTSSIYVYDHEIETREDFITTPQSSAFKMKFDDARNAFQMFWPVRRPDEWNIFLIDAETKNAIPYCGHGLDVYINMCKNGHIVDPVPFRNRTY